MGQYCQQQVDLLFVSELGVVHSQNLSRFSLRLVVKASQIVLFFHNWKLDHWCPTCRDITCKQSDFQQHPVNSPSLPPSTASTPQSPPS